MKCVFLPALLLSLTTVLSVSAHTIKVAFPQNIPPWVIQSENSGISVDIISQALKTQGFTLIPHYIPFSRMVSILENKDIDGVALVEGNKIKNKYYSDTTSYFSTSLLSLSKHNFQLTSLASLYDKRTMAFQDASKVFPDLAQLANNSVHYQEIANQENQVALLFKERVDFILLDKNIFHYWRHKLTKVDTSEPVTFHNISLVSAISVKSPTHTVFKDKYIRDAFNKGLALIIKSGEYQRIIDYYIQPPIAILK